MTIHQHQFLKETMQVTAPTLINGASQYMKVLERKEMSPETIRGYQVDLKQFSKFLLGESNTPVFVDRISGENIEQFVDSLLKKNLQPASVNRKINSISSFCNFALKKHWLAYNPAADVDRMKTKSKERTFLSISEMQQLIDAIEHPIIKTVAILMSNTGLRVSEATDLQLKDVDFEERVIHVIEGKGGKDRDVPMNEALAVKLDEYLKNIRPNVSSLFFFATKKTGMVSPQYVNRALKETCKKIGLEKDVTSHVLRHSFASQLVKTSTHVAHIQRLLGHADVRTTSIYMHAEQQDLADAVNTINFLKGDDS